MSEDMTREDVQAAYRSIQTVTDRIISLAVNACSRPDMIRAAKQIGLRPAKGLSAHEDEETTAMMSDVALFEPNQRGRIAFNTFCQDSGARLSLSERALAVRMADSRFSLFSGAEIHPVAGVWLEDVLDADRRFWLMDETLETSLVPGTVMGMRLFDAGPFHVGHGVVTFPDEETIHMSVASQERRGRQPFRHSLAARLYGDRARELTPFDPKDEWIVKLLVASLKSGLPIPGAPKGPGAPTKKTRR